MHDSFVRCLNLPRKATWNTPLDAVNLVHEAITLIGTEISMTIGLRFDTSGTVLRILININIFDRHVYSITMLVLRQTSLL